MNKIGIVSAYWSTSFTANVGEYDDRITRAAHLGFDLLSLFHDVPLALSKSEQQRLIDKAGKNNIKLNYISGLAKNQDLCSDSAEVRMNGVQHLRNLARKLADMQKGAELSGLLTGTIRDSLQGRDRARCWEYCVSSWKEAIKEAEEKSIIISIEVMNRFEHFLINTCEQAVRFIEEVGSPNLKILLDTYHMNIEEDSFSSAICTAGDKLGLLHIGENNRRCPGSGHIPWTEVCTALKQINYRGDIVMEPVVLTGGIAGNVLGVWRDLTDGVDLDEAAKKGMEFFRSKLASA
jgi:D-psicose/D-tagatose/L-ribulose 3-epimerase